MTFAAHPELENQFIDASVAAIHALGESRKLSWGEIFEKASDAIAIAAFERMAAETDALSDEETTFGFGNFKEAEARAAMDAINASWTGAVDAMDAEQIEENASRAGRLLKAFLIVFMAEKACRMSVSTDAWDSMKELFRSDQQTQLIDDIKEFFSTAMREKPEILLFGMKHLAATGFPFNITLPVLAELFGDDWVDVEDAESE